MKSVFKKFIFTALLFISFVSHSVGQQAIIEGKVINDRTNETLTGVVVLAEDSVFASTDTAGHFRLILKEGPHRLRIKMLGFVEKKVSVDVRANETKTLLVKLEERSSELGLVVVSAGKFEQRIEDVTVSMEVIKPSLVENKNTTSMDEIIDQVPGVSVIDGQANIRGGAGWSYGAGSRVLVLVDDLPMLTADAGDAKWNFLPIENLEQVEVIKGASSALFGSSALNGVINIRTAYPKDTPQTKINAFSGLYDTPFPKNLKWWGNQKQRYSGINFFHSRKIKNMDLVIGGNLFKDDGYREGESENRFRFNGNFRYRFKKIEGLAAGVNFNHMKTSGGLFFIWANDTSGAYKPLGGLHPDSTTISDYTTHRTSIDPFVTYLDKKGNSFKIRTRYFNTINTNSTNQASTSHLYYLEFQYQKRFSDQLILTGGFVQNNTKVTSELYGNHDGNNPAYFLQADAKWSRFTFSFGARAEQNRIDDIKNKFTSVVRAGINYRVLKGTYLRASYGQGYRFPSVAEKFIRTQVGGLVIYPNDSVASEKGFSSEIGIRQGIQFHGWKGLFDVAAFWTEYRNMVEFTFGTWGKQSDPFFGLGFKAFNTGDTRIKGIDLSLSGTGNIGAIAITVLAGYTYMEPEQLVFDSLYIKKTTLPYYDSTMYLGSDSSNFLKYRFNHLAKLDLEFSYRKFSVGFGFRYNSFMKNIDKLFVDTLLGSLITPGVAHYRILHRTGDVVYDLRTAFQYSPNIKLSFICKNVFNNVFMQRPADMQPPRTFVVQLGFVF